MQIRVISIISARSDEVATPERIPVIFLKKIIRTSQRVISVIRTTKNFYAVHFSINTYI